MDASTHLNPVSGAFTGPIAAALISLALVVQNKPVRADTLVGLTGNTTLGAGAGVIKSLLDCAFYCLLDKETRTTTVFKVFDRLINAAFLWTSLFTSPLLGEAILNYGTSYTRIIAAEFIGMGIFLGAGLSLAICCLITAGCFFICSRVSIRNLVTSPADHNSNFDLYETARAQRRAAYLAGEALNLGSVDERIRVEPSQVVEEPAQIIVFADNRNADLPEAPQISAAPSHTDEENPLPEVTTSPSRSVSSSLWGPRKVKDESHWIPESESPHSSSFSCPGV